MVSEHVQKIINKFLQIYEFEEKIKSRPEASNIHVDEVASKVAAFYEKIRKIVDWREEHLMRRIAIKRIFKRRIFLKKEDNAEDFVMELIRGGHFSNNKIERAKIKEIKKIIDKYLYVLQKANTTIEGDRSLFWNEALEIGSCEIEETLDPVGYMKTNAVVEFMEDSIKNSIIIGRKAAKLYPLSQEQKDGIIYIAIQQALFDLDEQLICYNILKRKNPNWREIEEKDFDFAFSQIVELLNDFEEKINHPIFNKIFKICELKDTPFLLIGDIIAAAPTKVNVIFSDEKSLTPEIRKSYEKRLEKLRGRIVRTAIYSTISIFVTKVLLLYIIEVPFSKIMGNLNAFAQVLEIVIPTFLMLLLVTTIRMPSVNNFRMVIEEIKRIAFTNKKDIYEAEIHGRKGVLMRMFVGFVYFLSFVLFFGVYFLLLYRLAFPPLSWFIFMIFISLILFTGVKIRRRAQELEVQEKKEGFIVLTIDLMAMPFIRLGRKLSSYWRKLNIINVLLNLLIEMPFLTFVNFLEEWHSFVKEKKDEIH